MGDVPGGVIQLPVDAESLAPDLAASRGRRNEPFYEVDWGHAHDALSCPLSHWWTGSCLPATLQELSDPRQRALLGGLPLLGAKRLARGIGEVCRGLAVGIMMAMVAKARTCPPFFIRAARRVDWSCTLGISEGLPPWNAVDGRDTIQNGVRVRIGRCLAVALTNDGAVRRPDGTRSSQDMVRNAKEDSGITCGFESGRFRGNSGRQGLSPKTNSSSVSRCGNAKWKPWG